MRRLQPTLWRVGSLLLWDLGPVLFFVAFLGGLPLYLLFVTDANRVATVAVFPAVFPAADCARVVAASEKLVAAQNGGSWPTDRHSHYPTTDLVATKIPPLAALWENSWQNRVFSLVAEQFHIPAAALVVDDLFVVRYAAAHGQQRGLVPHADRSHISFNLALNGAFEGGGTAFVYFPGATVLLKPGDLLVHDSRVRHAGIDITAGVRYILVGFLWVGHLPWYALCWRQWGQVASAARIADFRTTPPRAVELPITSMSSLLLDLVSDSLLGMYNDQPLLLALVVALVLLLLVLLRQLAVLILETSTCADHTHKAE